jgi:hypothetical protein
MNATMKTWLWPINWYLRIRQLEAEVACLQHKNRELDAALRAAAISQTLLTSTYVSAVSAIASLVSAKHS